MSHRMQRINELLKKEMSLVISREIDDPRIKRNMITITKVDTAKDLHHAKVYFICLDKMQSDEVIKSLNSSRGLFLAILKKRLTIRYIPTFNFIYDDSIEKTNEVLNTIRELDQKKNKELNKDEETEQHGE